MTYQEFTSEVETKLEETMERGVKICSHKIVKNNGLEKVGITILEKEANISPTIYLEEYYQEFKEGVEFEKIMSAILDYYEEVRIEDPWKDNVIKDFEIARTKIAYKLINYEKNMKLLESTPHIRYLDLAIVYYLLLELDYCGTATMLIQNYHLLEWDINEGELYRIAHENTKRIVPFRFGSLLGYMKEIANIPTTQKEELVEDDFVYILSNSTIKLGAASILYEGVLKGIGNELDDNYYLLPSSIHEVIIVKEGNGIHREELKKLVEEINANELAPEEILSNRTYYYNREQDRLE